MDARILVVDDDELMREALKVNLEHRGYVVETVDNGKDAIDIVKREFFNLALIDVHLADMTGIGILDVVNEVNPRMIKLIMTGYPTPESKERSDSGGADGFITKPFDMEDLLTKIEDLLMEQCEEIRSGEE